MNKKILLGLLILTFLLQGCGSKTGMQDGFYSAEMSGYSHGWNEYVYGKRWKNRLYRI